MEREVKKDKEGIREKQKVYQKEANIEIES